MEEIYSKLDQISNLENHYLVKARNSSDNYFKEFIKSAKIIKGILSESEFESWCSDKMFLKQRTFVEKSFIQYAVETAVVSYFCEKFPNDFKADAEIKPNSKKDVDCQFQDNGFKFNVEVKCSDFDSKEKIEKEKGIKYETVGRLDDRGQKTMDTISSALDEVFAKRGEQKMSHLRGRNMDNNLKDFLESAHNKFDPNPKENEVNILLVGCDNERDIQNWFNYLWAEKGLFTNQSFEDNDHYNNVDLVVFTNLYFKQNKFFDKKVNNCWTLDKSFNLIYSNPNRLLQKNTGISHFKELFPNYTEELNNYISSGDVATDVKGAVKIPHFIQEILEGQQDLYLFNKKE